MEIRRTPGGRAGRSSSSARWVPEVTLLTSSQSKDERDGLRLADMGEEILDDTYAELLSNFFPKEFEFIKQMHHQDRSFTLDQIKQTATNFYIDELSRNRRGLPSLDLEQLWPPRPTTLSAIGAKLMGTTSPTALVSRSCLLYTSPSPRDATLSRMPSSA